MAARYFHCEIVNRGEGPITWVDDKIESGDWVDDNVPSETAKEILPGQTGHYDAHSDGDIPLIGSIMTGTEGWALFKTTAAGGVPEFIKIWHELPYWAPPNNWHPVGGQVSRFDPRIQPGTFEWNARDTSDPQTRVNKTSEDVGSGNFLTEIQSLPWIIVWGFASWGGINVFARFHCHIKLEVTGNVEAASTTIPFGEPAPAPVPQAYRFSNPNLWSGTWDGERVTVTISASPSGLLDVVVTEHHPNQPDHTYEARNLSISRTFAYGLGDIRDTVLRPLDDETRSQILTGLEQREDSHGLLFEVQQLGGNERFVSEFISADHPQHSIYREIGSRFVEAGGWRPQEMGGDFLILPEDATLEIYSLVADGYTIGYSLRYRRPSPSPLLFAAGAPDAIDDMLYYRVVLR